MFAIHVQFRLQGCEITWLQEVWPPEKLEFGRELPALTVAVLHRLPTTSLLVHSDKMHCTST